MGRKSTTGGVTPLGGRIQIRFSWRGKELRPTLDMKPTAANLKHAQRIRLAVLEDIKLGALNLAEYFPDYKFLDEHVDTGGRTLKDWADVWEKLAKRSLEASTLHVYVRHLKAYWLSEFGAEPPARITHERVLSHLSTLASDRVDERTGKVLRGLERKTQNNILIPLRAVFELICKSDPTFRNPVDGIDNLKVQKSPPDPFSLDEVEAVLPVVEKKFSKELADYFEFACFAGLRSSEQIALLWKDVDLRSGVLLVRRARVLANDKERTKTAVQREVEMNSRARAVIERQRAITQLAGGHVFRNPFTGEPWHDEQTQRRRWETALRIAGIRYRPPKECRDTSVTLALMAGADPVWVAKQHGHSLQVMMRDYAKWIPGADRGRNLAAVDRALLSNSAVEPQYAIAGN